MFRSMARGRKRESEGVLIFSLSNLDSDPVLSPFLLLLLHGGPALARLLTTAKLTSAGAGQGDTLFTHKGQGSEITRELWLHHSVTGSLKHSSQKIDFQEDKKL